MKLTDWRGGGGVKLGSCKTTEKKAEVILGTGNLTPNDYMYKEGKNRSITHIKIFTYY